MPTCDICGQESPTERGLSLHKTKSHDEGSGKKEYECAECGDTFEDYPSRRETRGRETFFCSNECKHEYNTVEKFIFDCAWCGDEVVRHPSTVGEMGDYELKNHFCDKECESKFKQEEWVGEDHPSWVDNTVEMDCDECGEDIEVNEYYIGKLENHFCSHECHTEFQIEQKYAQCGFCDDEFELTPNQRMKQSETYYCSKDCRRNWRSESQKGEKNTVWRGGKEQYYGPNWHESRSAVLERDEFECQECGISREEHYDVVGVDLNVHHIEPLRTFDSDYESANDPENLITLCHHCHHQAEHGYISVG